MRRLNAEILRRSRRLLNLIDMALIFLKPVNDDHRCLMKAACKDDISVMGGWSAILRLPGG
jgi:hypothetical protein